MSSPNPASNSAACLLRDEVAQTVASPEDIDAELRHLLNALSA